MFKTSLISFLAFFVAAWMTAAINTNQWLPPDFVALPESPRVLIGLIAVYAVLLITCFFIDTIEKVAFNIASKVPKAATRWIYDLLFLLFSLGILKLVWTGISDKMIFSGFYQPYAAQFYFSSGISPMQLNGIFLFTLFILLITSFFIMRRRLY